MGLELVGPQPFPSPGACWERRQPQLFHVRFPLLFAPYSMFSGSFLVPTPRCITSRGRYFSPFPTFSYEKNEKRGRGDSWRLEWWSVFE